MIELDILPEDLKPVSLDEVPEQVRECADPSGNEPFSRLFIVRHADLDSATFVMEPSRYPTAPDPHHGGRTYSEATVVDILHEGGDEDRITGEGTIRYYGVAPMLHTQSQYDGRALVDWNRTAEGDRGDGFGGRRLVVMNAASLLMYGSALHSGRTLSPEARSLWQKFVDEGVAEPYDREGSQPPSYRFLA